MCSGSRRALGLPLHDALGDEPFDPTETRGPGGVVLALVEGQVAPRRVDGDDVVAAPLQRVRALLDVDVVGAVGKREGAAHRLAGRDLADHRVPSLPSGLAHGPVPRW